MSQAKLFVISAPSGAGKTTLLRRVMADLANLSFSVSHTTRSPRTGERDGVDYFFVDRAGFQKMVGEGGFLEWAEVHGNCYGTSRAAVLERLAAGVDVILDIDVQGARQIREAGVEAVFLFIAPPSWQELERRLAGRGTDSAETIRLRCANARREMTEAGWYDYLVVNDDLREAVETFRAVILAERSRQRRRPDGTPVRLDLGSGHG